MAYVHNVPGLSVCRNLLLNVGPTADGRIVPAFEERLLQMGAWLEVKAGKSKEGGGGGGGGGRK